MCFKKICNNGNSRFLKKMTYLKYEALICARLHNIIHIQAICKYERIVNNAISLNRMWRYYIWVDHDMNIWFEMCIFHKI